MSREEAQFWLGFYGIPWPSSDVTDAESYLDGIDTCLAGIEDEERAAAIMQALYRELN